MSTRLVEVNLISATDLSRSRLVNKQWPAALLEFPGTNVKQSSQPCLNGKVHQCIGSFKGNNNPVWNQQFTFRVDESVLLRPGSNLVVRIYASDNFKDRELGTALIPLTGAVYNIEQLQSGSYNVYKYRNRIDGKVNVSVKVCGPRFSNEQLERTKPPRVPQVPQQAQSYLNARIAPSGFGGHPLGYNSGYPQAPRAQHYQPNYNQRPRAVYSSQRPSYGGYGGRPGGGRRGGMGMGPGLLMGGLGGLALGGALDGGGCGGGGCGGGGCGGGGCGG